jgi:hypothetical protein
MLVSNLCAFEPSAANREFLQLPGKANLHGGITFFIRISAFGDPLNPGVNWILINRHLHFIIIANYQFGLDSLE